MAARGDSRHRASGTNFGTGLANIINGTATGATGRTGHRHRAGQPSVPSIAASTLACCKKVGDFTLGAMAQLLRRPERRQHLSTPNLVALDNEEAKIVVGQNVPFVTGPSPSTGTATNPFHHRAQGRRPDAAHQAADRRRRHRAHGGLYQESRPWCHGHQHHRARRTDKSSIETTVVVDDGDIIVLGRPDEDEYTGGADGVPGLSKRHPVIGNLFR